MRRPTRSAALSRMSIQMADHTVPAKLTTQSALSNENTSAEGKQHAREQLKALGAEDFDYESKIPDEQHKDRANVIAGLKR
jgi:hypothetical protein